MPLIPAVTVFAGPKKTRGQVLASLVALGATESPPAVGQDPGHGLPSHASHAAARAVRRPNAGHTPGTPHPETGEPYEPDDRVAWITVRGLPDRVDLYSLLEPHGWTHRLSIAESNYQPEEYHEGTPVEAFR